MKKEKLYHIYEPIFKQNIYFYYSDDPVLYLREVKKRFHVDLNPDEILFADANTTVIESRKKGIRACIVWMRKKDIHNLYHEAFHVTSHILNTCGVKLCRETDEIYAYFLSYLANEIWNL